MLCKLRLEEISSDYLYVEYLSLVLGRGYVVVYIFTAMIPMQFPAMSYVSADAAMRRRSQVPGIARNLIAKCLLEI